VSAGNALFDGGRRGVGRDHPLSMEKLSPILAFYVVDGCQACAKLQQQVLAYGGMGHTAGIHTRSREAAVKFGARCRRRAFT
jgi:hypothetical protein